MRQLLAKALEPQPAQSGIFVPAPVIGTADFTQDVWSRATINRLSPRFSLGRTQFGRQPHGSGRRGGLGPLPHPVGVRHRRRAPCVQLGSKPAGCAMTDAAGRRTTTRDGRLLSGQDDRHQIRPRGSSVVGVRESVTLTPELVAAGQARRLTRRMCADASLSDDVNERATLCAGEVVTNAVVTGQGSIRFTITTLRNGVLAEVGDGSATFPERHSPDLNSIGGRGLQVLDGSASSWGVRGTPRGKVVWFQVFPHERLPDTEDGTALLAVATRP